MQEVKKDVPFTDVIKAPDAFKGITVAWGGVVIETVVQADDTLVIVRQTDLDFQKRPINLDTSAGRFIIRHKGFLDPAIYSKDREVTAVGKIAGKEERPIGDYRYVYPVIDSQELRLWEKRLPLPYYHDPWWEWPYPGYYHPWHHPYRW
jgi:outer membrane lipoprotein